MKLKGSFCGTLALLAAAGIAFCSFGRGEEVAVPADVRWRTDSGTKTRLLDSLNGFLAQMERPASENVFVRKEDALETALLLDEMRGMEAKGKSNDTHFYRPYLINCAPVEGTNFVVQVAYMGKVDEAPGIRASFRVVAVGCGERFCFASPLRRNTEAWKQQEVRGCRFYFRQTLNEKVAADYAKLAGEFDRKLKATAQMTEIYCCAHFPEALQLIGVDYKSDYNGLGAGALSTEGAQTIVVVNGAAGGDFHSFDAHDLWHERLHHVVSTRIINKPVDEGCAYLYGGSWGLSWPTILARFREKLAGNAQADWLALYEAGYNFGESQEKHLIAGYVMNALLAERIEREKGFDAVMEWLRCGKYEAGNANYFGALERIIGINKANFNEEIWKLVRAE